jgi:hypothetical protein
MGLNERRHFADVDTEDMLGHIAGLPAQLHATLINWARSLNFRQCLQVNRIGGGNGRIRMGQIFSQLYLSRRHLLFLSTFVIAITVYQVCHGRLENLAGDLLLH